MLEATDAMRADYDQIRRQRLGALQNPIDRMSLLDDDVGVELPRRFEARDELATRLLELVFVQRELDRSDGCEIRRRNDDGVAHVERGDLRLVPARQERSVID